MSDLDAYVADALRGGASGFLLEDVPPEQLVVTEATVKTRVAHLFAKLGVCDRAQAVVVAYDTGLVKPRRDPRA